MMRNFLIRRLLAVIALLLLPSHVLAQSCAFSISNVAFGNVNTLGGGAVDTTATLSITCSGLPLITVRICPSIGAGSGGATAGARQMTVGASTLNYQLYQDAGRTLVWGSYNWGLPATPPTFDLAIALNGTGNASVPIFGRVFGGQGTVTPNSYASTFSVTDNDFVFATLGLLPCPGILLPQHAHPTFTVTASVLANCNVAAQTMNFGTQGVLNANVDAQGLITTTCTPGTPYNIGLDGGLASGAPAARKMTLGAQSVTYGLFRDAARTQPWGNTIGTNTATGTGTGLGQPLTVFGRIAPQITPPAGTYTDTIVVTVTF
jgi:spore coat protein U-like protein